MFRNWTLNGRIYNLTSPFLKALEEISLMFKRFNAKVHLRHMLRWTYFFLSAICLNWRINEIWRGPVYNHDFSREC